MEPTKTKKKLPLFQLVVDENDPIEGINAISLVTEPAIEVPFIMMNKEKEIKFEIASQDKQILFGPVLIPGKPIFRREFTLDGDANVFFSADDVEKIVQLFFRNKNEGNVNLEHSLTVDGAVLFQSFISDKENGINPKQFADLPDKTFFVAYKVYDDDLWKSCKDGVFTGFSLEGFFDSIQIKNNAHYTDDDILDKVIEITRENDEDVIQRLLAVLSHVK